MRKQWRQLIFLLIVVVSIILLLWSHRTIYYGPSQLTTYNFDKFNIIVTASVDRGLKVDTAVNLSDILDYASSKGFITESQRKEHQLDKDGWGRNLTLVHSGRNLLIISAGPNGIFENGDGDDLVGVIRLTHKDKLDE